MVINDGKDPTTRDLLHNNSFHFQTRYREIDHPLDGFGLCIARNLGLETAQGDLICYLDDDNALRPTFVANTLHWFEQHPDYFGLLPQQWRRRDVIRNGQVVKTGQSFISPQTGDTISDLIAQRSLFDSNGFTHQVSVQKYWVKGVS